MRVLVTGHNGYIGSVMVPVLTAAGNDVFGVDTGFYADCTLGLGEPIVRGVRQDVRDVTATDLKGFEAVVHLAALSNDPLGSLNPALTDDINHQATVHLAKLAKEAGVGRFVYASSCSMYGAGEGDALLDETSPLQPLTPYAESKLRSEEDLHKLATKKFSPIYMRNATAYGMSPRFRADIVLNNLMCWAYTTGRVRVMSDGSPWRPLVHVEDICRATAALLAAPREAVHDQAFNIGVAGENYQVRDLVNIVCEVVEGAEAEYAARGGAVDKRNYRVDFAKFARVLPEFKPKWDARKGAEQILAAFKDAGFKPDDFHLGRFTRLAKLQSLLESKALDASLRWTRPA